MKKNILCLVFFLLSTTVFGLLPFENSQYTYYNDGVGTYYFEFSKGKLIIQDWQQYEDQKDQDSVELPGFPGLFSKVFIENYNIIEQNGFLIINTKKRSFICLFHESDICILIDIESAPNSHKRVYWGINSIILKETKQKVPGIFTPEWESKIRVSTFLSGTTKQGIRYKPPFGRIGYSAIWIEGAKGNGIGEWIEIDNTQITDKLLFLNGVILPTSLSSFIENSRIKKIQIDFNGFSQIVELTDTPNPQIVNLGQKASKTRIRITILDVYKGTKYTDCGLSFFGTIFLDSTLKSPPFLP